MLPGLGLTAFTCVAVTLWTFTYMYRVASKDMTYTKQLKDYEVRLQGPKILKVTSPTVIHA